MNARFEQRVELAAHPLVVARSQRSAPTGGLPQINARTHQQWEEGVITINDLGLLANDGLLAVVACLENDLQGLDD